MNTFFAILWITKITGSIEALVLSFALGCPCAALSNVCGDTVPVSWAETLSSGELMSWN